MTSNSKGNHKMLNHKKDSNHKTHNNNKGNKDSKDNKVVSKVLRRAVLIQVCHQCPLE